MPHSIEEGHHRLWQLQAHPTADQSRTGGDQEGVAQQLDQQVSARMRRQWQHGKGIAKGYCKCHDDRELRHSRIATQPLGERQSNVGIEPKSTLLEGREIAGVWLQDPACKPHSDEGNQNNADRDPEHGER